MRISFEPVKKTLWDISEDKWKTYRTVWLTDYELGVIMTDKKYWGWSLRLH